MGVEALPNSPWGRSTEAAIEETRVEVLCWPNAPANFSPDKKSGAADGRPEYRARP
jgi:hypothetical protein